LSQQLSLLSIIGYARGGALDHAWRLFREGGFERQKDDPAVLCVLGRLLKDRAREKAVVERQHLYWQAAEAYARAGEISGTTYPLINAATLTYLSGRKEQTLALANQVVALCESATDKDETPYYCAATQSEAWLLLGDFAKAKVWLAKAMECAPRAYEDHASTLRQFGLILAEQKESAAWLETYRPPRCLHFAGHLGVSTSDENVAEGLRAFLTSERIGFGYGALAAGADIRIAEALLDRGAELHVVLPSEPELFRERSVAPFGADWSDRFNDVLNGAESVLVVGQGPSSLLPLSFQLAGEVAMGNAIMQANMLMTEAVQLAVLDSPLSWSGAPGSTRWAYDVWAKTGRRQEVLIAPRTPVIGDDGSMSVPDTAECLAAVLRIEWSEVGCELSSADVAMRLASMLQRSPPLLCSPRWLGEELLLAFETPQAATIAGLAAIADLAGLADLRVAGHYGIARRISDPFGGPVLLTGMATALPREIMRSIPPGAMHVSEEFGLALQVARSNEHPSVGYVGDLPTGDCERPVRLFALRSRPSG
jgi:hypothetical protein